MLTIVERFTRKSLVSVSGRSVKGTRCEVVFQSAPPPRRTISGAVKLKTGVGPFQQVSLRRQRVPSRIIAGLRQAVQTLKRLRRRSTSRGVWPTRRERDGNIVPSFLAACSWHHWGWQQGLTLPPDCTPRAVEVLLVMAKVFSTSEQAGPVRWPPVRLRREAGRAPFAPPYPCREAWPPFEQSKTRDGRFDRILGRLCRSSMS